MDDPQKNFPTLDQNQGQNQDQNMDRQMQIDSENAEQQPKLTRKEQELARKDRTLAEFLVLMDQYQPIIPDAVTDFYLQRTGFDCDDVRVKRLLALATQKFISDIATDAFQYARMRQAGGGPSARKGTTGRDRNKTILTMDDLSAALTEYGINMKKPDYYY